MAPLKSGSMTSLMWHKTHEVGASRGVRTLPDEASAPPSWKPQGRTRLPNVLAAIKGRTAGTDPGEDAERGNAGNQSALRG